MARPTVRAVSAADHRYYYAISLGLAVIVFAGFARTYYLKGLFEAPPLPLLVHVHGAVMTLWYALFVVQVRLVAAHRVALHRRLGTAGIVLAGLVAVLGTAVSFGLAKREWLAQPDSIAAPFLLAYQLFAIVLVFIVLISLGVYYRRRPDYHKRFMVLAMLTVLGPAVTRLPLPFLPNHNVPFTIALDLVIVITCLVVDTVRNRRLHKVFGWGGLLVIGSIFVITAFARSSVWSRTARWLLF
jgi:hypothetical protein